MGARESLVDKVEPLIMQNLKRGVGGRGGGGGQKGALIMAMLKW